MYPFFGTMKDSVFDIAFPGKSFPRELHKGCIIRFLAWFQTFHQLFEKFAPCGPVHFNRCHFAAACKFFCVDIFIIYKAAFVLLILADSTAREQGRGGGGAGS